MEDTIEPFALLFFYISLFIVVVTQIWKAICPDQRDQ